LVIELGLPFKVNVEDVALIVPPVFVIEEPAAIVNVVAVALIVALILFVITAELPFKFMTEVELIVTVPELVIDPPAAIFTVEPVTVREPVLVLLLI